MKKLTDYLGEENQVLELTMKPMSPEDVEEMRKRRNADVLKRLKAGDPLKAYDNQSSWFPPRPVIQKDKQAIAKLYSNDEDVQD